ncbi:AraC family transcriptional regulator [Duganella aceris]|uniref:AraC family transcriptional regulator n=1 Tax=Duganella aceris TaxID=2703883 RepID=A0ABX0FFT0_9BURK|nr:AraC family transcriptional regulator [Duganella aceris]NGZ83384.1 AraC family transcriptional regulator [Duganella aceris]
MTDPLSDVLALLRPRSYVSAGFDAGGAWSVGFPHNVGIKCYAVVSGACWLVVDGVADPIALKGGDCFLLPGGRTFRLASDPALPATASTEIFGAPRIGNVVTLNGGGDLFLVGSRFVLSGSHAEILLAMLPPVVHISKESEQAALRWSVERMMLELQQQRPGSFLIAEHLAHMMLVQALRLHMDEGAGGVGWLFALADKQMGAAIGAMHAAPAQRWTLQSLAERVHMSRSAFALRFKQMVGMSAMDYLTRWRMLLAGDRLANSSDPISVIAPALGYESESAFSTAFKRVMGCAPRQYKA